MKYMKCELFSTRQKKLRGEVPEVYHYEIPDELRTQIIYIWQETLIYRGAVAINAYNSIYKTLCYQYGKFELLQVQGYSSLRTDSKLNMFFLSTSDTERAIDVIKLSFQYIDQDIRINCDGYFKPRMSPDEAISELNRQFREHSVGYQYEAGKIIKDDSQWSHAEMKKPTLNLLSCPDYKGANEEFLKANEHYRSGRYKECLIECLKAFESCLKVICKKRGWTDDKNRDTAKGLIEIVFKQELIPDFMQSHFSGLRSTLESGLPTLRNRMAAHGQGSEEVTVPEYIAGYALRLTGSNILLLAKADEHMKV